MSSAIAPFTLLPFALCLLLGFQAGLAAAVADGTSLVPEVCGQCKNRDMCLSSLGADPNTQGADLSALTLISIRVATANATDTLTYIRQMLYDRSLEPGVQQALSDCTDAYVDAVQQLDDSLAALTVRNYADLSNWVQTAAAEADSCATGFGGADKLGVSRRSETFRQLCDNALTVIGLLEKNKQ